VTPSVKSGVIEFARSLYGKHPELKAFGSETKGRIRDWKHGRRKPGVDTARILDRMLAAERRRLERGKRTANPITHCL
jgi:hypothetical protein